MSDTAAPVPTPAPTSTSTSTPLPATEAPPVALPPAEHRLAIRFVGSGSEYFRIWIVNLLLTIVTLGLYHPFAKVRRLRYFYGSTEVGGQPLSFHADPWRMLRGFLLMVLLFAVYAGAGHWSPVAGVVAFAVLAALWPALWHSALHFRMANTGWRGLRFHFTGRLAGAYATWAPLGVVALGFVVLGAVQAQDVREAGEPLPVSPWWGLLPLVWLLAMPAFFWLLKRYQHQHLALGEEVSRFKVRPRHYYALALRVFGLYTLGGVGLVLLMLPLAALANGQGGSPSWMALLPMLFMLLLMSVLWPYVVSRSQNLVWNGTASPAIAFESQLRWGPLAQLTVANLGLMVVTLGLYYPFATVALARLRLEAVSVRLNVDPEQLVASQAAARPGAAGDAAADMLGLDVGL
jgi:uncharacterized membrane protein YjgN (DUF898 family)